VNTTTSIGNLLPVAAMAALLAGCGQTDAGFAQGPAGASATPLAAPAAPDPRYPKPPDAELRSRLTPLQYEVTQRNGTEDAFLNSYWNEKREGIYVDVVSGEPLFSSRDKYDSGTGWPSFTRPLEPANVLVQGAFTFTGTEVRSRHAGSHLGHVFLDGPGADGHRFCINSAALRFVPREALAAQGYAEYAGRFEAR
jgi:methionine-R-sulfoxide reductase